MFDLGNRLIFNNNVTIYNGTPLYLEIDHGGFEKWTFIFKNERHLKTITGYELLEMNYHLLYVLKFRYVDYKTSDDDMDFKDEVFDFRKVTKKLNMEDLTEEEEETVKMYSDDDDTDEMEDYFDNEDENV